MAPQLFLLAALLADPPSYTEPATAPTMEQLKPEPKPPPFTINGYPAGRPVQQQPIQLPGAPKGFVPRQPRHFGIMAGVNIGLFAIDIQAGHFYAYLSAGMGVTLLSDMRFGAFAGGAGYTLQIKRARTLDWYLDMMAMGVGGWQDVTRPSAIVRYGYGGVGLGVGFRMEHVSGFSLGFKIPVFGYAFGPQIRRSADGVGLYYLSSLASLPIVSLGYRF